MAFIPVNVIYTDQLDFEDPSVIKSNIDTVSKPNSFLLEKNTSSQNIQTLNSSNNFRGTISLELEVLSGKIILKSFSSRLMNIIPARTKTTSEDYLTLPYAPINSSSLILRVDGLILTAGVDYSLNSATGRADLISSFSTSSSFEASYLSEGILACEGELETEVINIGFEATTLEIQNQGSNLEATQIWIKVGSDLADLENNSWIQVNTFPYNFSVSDKVLKLKFIFIPPDFESTTFPVTFKYNEDWNLSGSSFSNTSLNNQKIEITSSNNQTTNVASLPIPTTLAGLDYFKDTTSNDYYLVVAAGYESPNTISKYVRMAKIKPDHTLENWQDLKFLPGESIPYNGLKIIKINNINYVYVLNNNNTKNIYKGSINQYGVNLWNSQLALPRNLNKANLEILSDTLNNEHILIVQNEDMLYWANLNNSNGNISNNHWNSFKLPEKQKASATVLFQSSNNSNIWFLYILGGIAGGEEGTAQLITKVTITKTGATLSFSTQTILTQLPKKLSHFTSEIIDFNSSQFLYVFGGTSTSNEFSDKSYSEIYRVPIDLSSGDFTGIFEISPNKLYTASSGHNTAVIKNNNNGLCTYVIGDSSRASSRVSCIELQETASSIRSGIFETGIFEIPGCDIQFGNFSYDKLLRNSNQSVTSSYRTADSITNLNSAPYIPIINNSNISGNPDHKFIQFLFYLEKDPLGSTTELSPTLNSFTFIFTSNVSSSSQTPELISSELTFDNTLLSNTGEILFKYDSLDPDTEYTDLTVNTENFINGENIEVSYRTGNDFPLTGTFNPLSNLFTSTTTGRYFETKVILNPSSDQLFSPIVNDIAITGIQPQNVSNQVDQFIFHEIPSGDQNEINQHYITFFPFEPGSLQVFVNGVEQLPGTIYTEGLDNQSFDFVSYAPDALDIIFVNYIKPL
jgi:hypothetical protein